MPTLEFFFDLSSPWTRVAFHNVQAVVAETGATIIWRPFLVGGVFNAVNDSVYAGRADPNNAKNRNVFKWLKEWAALAGVPMNFPSPHHPLKAVAAMRFCCALEDDQEALFVFAARAFEAYFTDQRNLDDVTCLIAIADACGLDGKLLAERAVSETIKQKLRTNTQEAIERGAFGSPMMFVDGKFAYFGNDQLPLVARRISQHSADVVK
jgi:2-hydroxychromene-2-carboxylate isomerase